MKDERSKIGPLVITRTEDQLRSQDMALLGNGKVLIAAGGLLVLLGLLMLSWVGLAVPAGITGAGVLGVFAGVAFLVRYVRTPPLASHAGGMLKARGIQVPDDATVHVDPMGGNFATVILTPHSEQIVLAVFRWRRDAEELGLFVADYLRLQYVTESGDTANRSGLPKSEWPPAPKSAPIRTEDRRA